jgi:hypothetical protein
MIETSMPAAGQPHQSSVRAHWLVNVEVSSVFRLLKTIHGDAVNICKITGHTDKGQRDLIQ